MSARADMASWGPYSAGRAHVFRAYGQFISGNDAGLFVVLAGADCTDAAREALAKSAQALGYGADGVTFVSVAGQELSGDALYEVVEGLDPIALVCAGEEATRLFSQAYRLQAAPHAAQRVQGREVRLLPQIAQNMETPQGKQLVWHALKSLPRLDA